MDYKFDSGESEEVIYFLRSSKVLRIKLTSLRTGDSALSRFSLVIILRSISSMCLWADVVSLLTVLITQPKVPPKL